MYDSVRVGDILYVFVCLCVLLGCEDLVVVDVDVVCKYDGRQR